MSNVISSDIQDQSDKCIEGKFLKLDVTCKKSFSEAIKEYKINKIIHLANISPADSEKDIELTTKVNIEGVHTALELAKEYKISIFIPSSAELNSTSKSTEECLTDPQHLYGITKLYMEKLGNYYYDKYSVDFRCLRYPIVLSKWDDYGAFTYDMLFSAMNSESYNISFESGKQLPFIHIEDCVRGTCQFIDSHNSLLKRRVYNMAGISFSSGKYFKELKKVIKFNATNELDHSRINYLKLFPEEINDNSARSDWGWSPQIQNVKKIIEHQLMNI